MEILETSCMPTPEAGENPTMQERVRGTNISETTYLATDYLNHFNEVIMILDMIPAMPELLDELIEWEPKSYQQHFRDAAFADAALAVEAYNHVPAKYRGPFEEIIRLLDHFVEAAIRRLRETTTAGDQVATVAVVGNYSQRLTKLVDLASAIIHGREDVLDRAQVDILFPDHC